MIEYTQDTSREECINLSSELNITFLLNKINQTETINNNTLNSIDESKRIKYCYQKDLLTLLSEINAVESKINYQRHQTLESILSSKKTIDKEYIQLITQHHSINLDILNIREQVYRLLSNI